MKSSELRIGSLLLFSGKQIVEIGVGAIESISTGNTTAFQPIPLTLMWLRVAGAMKIRDGRYFIGINPVTDDFLMVIGENADGFYFQNAGHPLKFVHQLQNLYLSLTGKELKFNYLNRVKNPQTV